MAKPKVPDKFGVGELATIWFGPELSACAELFNGQTVEIARERKWSTGMLRGYFYKVKLGGDLMPIEERHLRAIYDGANPSTWAEFAKVTGLDLPGSCIVAKPVQRKVKVRHG